MITIPGINKLGLLNHHSGYRGQVEIKDSKLLNSKKVAYLEANVGDIVLLHRHSAHCSIPNKSNNFRISADLRYNKAGQTSGREPLPSFYVKSKNKKTIISLDTRKPDVMRAGIKNNIDLINDVSGLRYSSKSIDLIKKNKIPFVLMHSIKNPKTMQSNINYENVLLDVYDFFKKKIAICERKKINRQSIILDPGIGFGKTVKQNLSLISNIALLHSLGCPVLLGSSRKTFIGKLDKNALEEKRLGGSLSTVIYALSQGVQVFRVHDVFETSQAIKVFNKL